MSDDVASCSRQVVDRDVAPTFLGEGRGEVVVLVLVVVFHLGIKQCLWMGGPQWRYERKGRPKCGNVPMWIGAKVPFWEGA